MIPHYKITGYRLQAKTEVCDIVMYDDGTPIKATTLKAEDIDKTLSRFFR